MLASTEIAGRDCWCYAGWLHAPDDGAVEGVRNGNTTQMSIAVGGGGGDLYTGGKGSQGVKCH